MTAAQLHDMSHGVQGLELGYTLILAGMVAGLIHGQASQSKLLLSPLVAVPVVALVGIVISLTSPLLHVIDTSSERVLALGFGVVATMIMGYASGRAWAAHKKTPSGLEHRRSSICAPALRSGDEASDQSGQ
jgi:hypothetical protein